MVPQRAFPLIALPHQIALYSMHTGKNQVINSEVGLAQVKATFGCIGGENSEMTVDSIKLYSRHLTGKHKKYGKHQ
jgi:hypothetical protein